MNITEMTKTQLQTFITNDGQYHVSKKLNKSQLLAIANKIVENLEAEKAEKEEEARKAELQAQAEKEEEARKAEFQSMIDASELAIKPLVSEIVAAIKFYQDLSIEATTQRIDKKIADTRSAINYGKSMPTKTEKANRKNRAGSGLSGNLAKHARTLLSLEFLNGESYVDPHSKLKTRIVDMATESAVIDAESLRNISDYRAAQCSTHLNDFGKTYDSNGSHFLRFGFLPNVSKRSMTLTLTLLSEQQQKEEIAMAWRNAIAKGKKTIDELILVSASGSNMTEQIQLIREKYPSIEIVNEEDRTLMLASLADIETETCKQQAERERAERKANR